MTTQVHPIGQVSQQRYGGRQRGQEIDLVTMRITISMTARDYRASARASIEGAHAVSSSSSVVGADAEMSRSPALR